MDRRRSQQAAVRRRRLQAFRLFGEYHGRITPTLRARVVVDYVDDASGGLDLTEAVIDWRPIPRSRNQQQVRFGAFYPSFSLENGDRGWQSPFTYSYSAINTWLGEEIRPVGAEWSLRRRLEGFRSAHEVRAFAAGFYGNDPAGTLLFWRGWSLHDRQSRLNDELEIPPRAVHDAAAAAVAVHGDRPSSRRLRRPRVALCARALVQLARYDNRADPYSFSDGQWGWGTDFNHLAVQVSLPAELGLDLPMDGRRDGVAHGGAAERHADADVGVRAGRIRVAVRDADAQDRRRRSGSPCVTTRSRPSGPRPCPCSTRDDGHAWTLSYRIEPTERFSGGIEWLRIDSQPRPLADVLRHAAVANRRPAPAAVLLPPRRPGALALSARPPGLARNWRLPPPAGQAEIRQ